MHISDTPVILHTESIRHALTFEESARNWRDPEVRIIRHGRYSGDTRARRKLGQAVNSRWLKTRRGRRMLPAH